MTDKSLIWLELNGEDLKLQSIGAFLMLHARSHSGGSVLVGSEKNFLDELPAVKERRLNLINANAEITVTSKPMDIDPSALPLFNNGHALSSNLLSLFNPPKNRLPFYSTIRRGLLNLDYTAYSLYLAKFFGIEPLAS